MVTRGEGQGAMTKKREDVISVVAKSYDLTTSPPNISDPKVMKKIDAEVIEKCLKDLEAADRGESASMAHAYEIWTW